MFIKKSCRGDHMIYALVQFLRQHKLVNFPQEHIWHIILCYQYVHNIWYPYYITEQTNLHHHYTTNHLQKAYHLKKIICHSTTHLNQYHVYHLTLIHTQVHCFLLCWTHQTNQTLGILNEEKVCFLNVGKKA